jgi:hypothetical protein
MQNKVVRLDPRGARVLPLKVVKINLAKLPLSAYDVLTETVWCDCSIYISLDEFKKNNQYKQGLEYEIVPDKIRFDRPDEFAEEFKWGYRINDEVNVVNAKRCGFGVLETTYNGKEVMFPNDCLDVDVAVMAYNALTYHGVSRENLRLLKEDMDYFKMASGSILYQRVLMALCIPG